MSPPPPRTSRRTTVLLSCAIVLLTVVAFHPALAADFVQLDDPQLITGNPHYRGFSAENLRWMFSTTLLGHYHPLTWASYALDHALWGMDPRGYHLTNVLLHAIAGVLVFMLGRRLVAAAAPAAGETSHTIAGFTAAFLFAVHPLRTESVAWVTERRDVLSAVFLLGSLIAYLRAVRHGSPGVASTRWYLLCVGLLALSLLSKAWGMSLFVICLVIDAFPLRRFDRSTAGALVRCGARLVVEKIPLIVLGLAAAAMAAHAQNSVLAAKTVQEWGVRERLVQSMYGLAYYPRTTLAPFGLAVLYPLPRAVDPLAGRYVIAYVLVLGAAVLALATLKRLPAIAAAFVAYAVLISPVLGFLQSGDQFVADRYSYLACIPLAMLIGGGVAWMWRRSGPGGPRRTVLGAGGALAAALLLLATVAQARTWRDNESLWRQAVRAAPSAEAHLNLGIELNRQQRHEEAMLELVCAVELNETFGYAWFVAGMTAERLGRYAGAKEAYLRAVEHMPQKFGPLVNLGTLHLNRLGDPDAAIGYYREAVADVERGGRRLLSTTPYLALGRALALKGDTDAAREYFRKALVDEENRAAAETELRALDSSLEN